MRSWGILIGMGMALGAVVGANERKFFADDPVWEDNDRIETPARPARIELSGVYDRFHHTFRKNRALGRGRKREHPGRGT